MLVTQLTVVNACLASMGEEPINSLAEENAFVNSAKFALESATVNEQSAGWWFNKERLRILPDISGSYIVPSDVIDLDIDSTPVWLAVRNSRLYDTSKAGFLTGTQPYEANITRLLAFEDVPFHGKRLIKAATVILFQQSYDGDAQKIREAQEEYRQAYLLCKAQHIRAVKANFSTADIRLSNMSGGRRGLRTPR
jgi:hypothetical protein